MPWLSGPLRLPIPAAIATSLLTISLASMGSLAGQALRLGGGLGVAPAQVGLLAAGSLAAALAVRTVMERASARATTAGAC